MTFVFFLYSLVFIFVYALILEYIKYSKHRDKMATVMNEAKFVMSLLAKIARSDGKVSQLEHKLLDRIIGDFVQMAEGDETMRDELKRVFNEQKENTNDAYKIAKEYKKFSKLNYDTCAARLEFFLNFAHTDGEFSDKERATISNIAYGFGIGKESFSEIVEEFTKEHDSSSNVDEKACFETLGLSEYARLEDVKERYKELARLYHPDVLATRGESDGVKEYANRRLRRINEACGRLKEKFGV